MTVVGAHGERRSGIAAARGIFAGPDDPAYAEAARSSDLAATTLRPAAAATARTAAEVRQAIAEAVRSGRPLLVLSTGHSAGMIAPVAEDAYALRVALDEPVTVDPARGLVRIPAGARWADVVEVTSAVGLAVPHASSPSVGAVGYLLGGGLSPYGRLFGVAANNVVSATVALADGSVRTVDSEHDPDLFWALRGGGGGLGVVLAVELLAVPATGVMTGMTVWDADAAGAGVARAWWEWTRTAPREATTSLRLLDLPDLPGVPEPMVGRQVLALDGAVLPYGNDVDRARSVARRMLEPLRRLAEPILDTWRLDGLTATTTTRVDPRGRGRTVTDAFLLREGGHDMIDRWVESAGPASGSELVVAELRQLGGAFADDPVFAGAFGAVAEPLAAFNAGSASSPAATDASRGDLLRIRGDLRRWITNRTVPTMIDDPGIPRRTFGLETEAYVENVRRDVDPRGLFRLDVRDPKGL
ncbi:FAD-binding oxidoreductase [Myceligenerans pegani]|uniref:FAD-dependent oxidoreductase n=1 Tax=Myceligenerans pegani TaxID=2776917 RepID=A0ABR9N6J8_9MICO|nr:FAD-dependent oxidoreductase [Myceligenerans sp. TRM 65318]MBE1878784.1 FAD-dependent oxidoreductase [Myceligenerans sp. TRM 65318]MBE3021055.1 FAD-dependent oxidoreductase [Myceligenerans sp. TRM 65318]